jgi:hypothetical protein
MPFDERGKPLFLTTSFSIFDFVPNLLVFQGQVTTAVEGKRWQE